MLLHTERGTRESVGRRRPGLRPLRRPARRLGQDDHARRRDPPAPARAARRQRADPRRAPVRRPRPAPDEPDPRRTSSLPPRLHELTAATWEELNKLADPGGDTPDGARGARPAARGLRRPLRGVGGDLALVRGRRRAAAQAAGKARTPGPRRPRGADRIPHGVRAAIPPSVRRGLRKVAGRERPRDAQPARACRTSRATPSSTSPGPGPGPAGCGRGPPRCSGSRTRPGAAVGAPAAAAGLRPRAGRRQRLHRRHPRGDRRDRRSGRAGAQAQPGDVPVLGGARRRRAPRRPERSVHSLAYFYNWCFAQVGTRYSWKWDGDMVLTTEGEVVDRRPRLAGRRRAVDHPGAAARALPRERLARATSTSGCATPRSGASRSGRTSCSRRPSSGRSGPRPTPVRSIGLPHGLCVELKYLDGDEFAHWTDPASFATQLPQQAQAPGVDGLQRAAGAARCCPACTRSRRPTGVHIVDFVTRDWLPRAPRPLEVGLPELAPGSPAQRALAGNPDARS